MGYDYYSYDAKWRDSWMESIRNGCPASNIIELQRSVLSIGELATKQNNRFAAEVYHALQTLLAERLLIDAGGD